MSDDPVQVKFECKEVDPVKTVKTAQLFSVHISPHNSAAVIDSEKSPINANRKSTMGFPTSHQPRSCVTHNFPKMGFRYPIFPSSQKVATKFYCLKNSSGKVVGP